MAQQDLISVNIPEADLVEIKAAIAVLKTKLMPHLKTLSAQDRMELPKLGDKSMAFMVKGAEHAEKNLALVPSFLDLDALKIDMAAVQVLRGLDQDLAPIQQALSDSITQSGSEAYQGMLLFYGNARVAAKANDGNAKMIYEDLAGRFPGGAAKKKA